MANKNEIQELTNQISRLADEVEQLNTEISSLNTGQIWGGTIVDALNEIARALNTK